MLGELSGTVVDTVDPAGQVGRDRLVYVLAAVALAVVAPSSLLAGGSQSLPHCASPPPSC